MRKIFIAFLILSQVLFAQEEEKRKIEDLIDEILKKVEKFYSTDEAVQNYELNLRQKEIQRQLEKVKTQLELLKKQKEFMDEEKFKEEIERIQKSAIEIQKTSQELIEQAKKGKIYSPFLFPSFRFKGETEIGVNDYIEGDVLVQDGDLTVYGKIKGNILVENGDVILKEGAEVKGDIYTTNGDIKISEGAKFEGKTYKNFSALAEIDRITSYDRRKHRQEMKYKQFYEEYPGIDNLYFEFERVSGFKIGLIYPRKISNILNKPIAIFGYGAYATKSHRWIFSVGIDRKIFDSGENFYILTGGEIYSTVGTKDNWLISSNANTISALLWNNDYRDYFKLEGFALHIELVSLSSPGNLKLTYSNNSYSSEVTRYIKYASWNKKRPFRENPQVFEGNLKSLALNFRFGNFHLIEGFKKSGLAFDLGFEKELGNIRYSIFTAELKARLSLSDYDNFGLRLKIGTSDKILPKQKSFEIGGFGTLYAFPFKSFEGNKIVLANFEYIIENITDILDFVNLFIFFDAGYTNNQEGKITSGFKIDNFDQIKSDFGFGLGTESMKTRIYFAWRTDKKVPPMIVIRLSNPF
jgi:hypothetical protein